MNARTIISQAADMFGVPVEAVLSPCRRRELADCRAVICYVLVQRYRLSFSEVGRILGRHHTDVMYHNRKCGDWMDYPGINPRGSAIILEMLTREPP